MDMKLEFGDFVLIKGQDESNPLMYRVVTVNGADETGGMTLVSRWYRTETLRKVERDGKD